MLEETIKEMEKELEELNKEEANGQAETTPPETAEEVKPVEENADGGDGSDAVQGESSDGDQKEPEEKLDNATAARMRRAEKAERQRAEKLEQEAADLRRQLEEARKPEAKESVELPPEIQEIYQERNERKAWDEFKALEAQAASKHADFADVSSDYTMDVARSIKRLNPRLSDLQVMDQTKKHLLQTAGELMREGYENPLEEMFLRHKEVYKAPVKEERVTEEKVIKPDLKKVAENRQRSTNMAAAPAKSDPPLTPMAVADMTAAEVAKLSPAEFEAVMRKLAS